MSSPQAAHTPAAAATGDTPTLPATLIAPVLLGPTLATPSPLIDESIEHSDGDGASA